MAIIALGYNGYLAMRSPQIISLSETCSGQNVSADITAVIRGRYKIIGYDRIYLRPQNRPHIMRRFHFGTGKSDKAGEIELSPPEKTTDNKEIKGIERPHGFTFG